MQSIDHILQMLELMEQPAFSVREGMITGVNAAARERMILPGAPVAPMIAAGRSDYSTLRSGSMALTLDLFGIMTDATVTCIGEHRIFKLSTPEQSEQLRVLALAAQELRSPLHDAMSISRELQHDDHAHPEQQEELSARLNRELYRILRIVGNMSFHSAAHPEMRDAAAVFEEIFASAAPYCEAAGVAVHYSGLPASADTLMDSDLIGRAVHNLLTNAIRGAGTGGTIAARLTRRGGTLYLTIQDSGGGTHRLSGNFFDAYRREPGIISTQGLGLGMTIVEAVAKAHGGVVMLEQCTGSGVRVTMSLPIRQDTSGLRSPSLRIDYAGEQSRELIEFSDVLPPDFYKL